MGRGSFLYRFLKLILPPVLRALYRVRMEGVERFPAEGGVIVVANHVSFMDSFFIPMCVPRRVIYLAKAEYFDSWKMAWLVRSLGMIPVKREVRSKAEAAIRAGVEVLEAGGVLGLYPEGTRSPDGKLYRGRTGVARLALRSKCPVVPVGLIGTREVMPKGAKVPKLRGRVTVRFGLPMTFEKYQGEETNRRILRKMTDEIMFEIMALTGQKYMDEYATKIPTVAPDDYRIPTDEEMLG
jgi:1-acyl-sn-glycerol-3-phosphate acyltransferase